MPRLTESDPPPMPAARGGRELLAAYRAGDRHAADELVDRTYSDIYGALFKLTGGDAELAADLTQETYRRAWQALARFEGRSAVSTWLYRIAYTTFLNHVRRPRKVVAIDSYEAIEPRDPRPSPERRSERDASGALLRRAVLDLEDDLRYPVTARYWGEVPVRQIAAELGVTPAAIRKRLKKALRLLGETLEEVTP